MMGSNEYIFPEITYHLTPAWNEKKKKKDHYGDCVLLRLSKPQNLIQRAANLKENQDKLENQDIS